MKNILRVMVIMFVASIVSIGGCKKEEASTKSSIPPEIAQFVDALFRAIVNEDIEYIEQVLYEGEIEYVRNLDYKFKPKAEIMKEIREKGRLYYELFDTEGLFEYMSKYENSDGKGNPTPVEVLKRVIYPYVESVKDRVKNRKNLRVERIEVLDKEKNILRCHLIDDYEIEMKKESPVSENIFLKKVDIIKKDGKLYLYSVFFDSGMFVD